MSLGSSSLSKEFFELVKSIGESRSKQEEDRIIVSEALTLKQRFNEPNVSASRIKEYLVRSLYVEMLGHDASFAYIHAVKLAHDKNLLCKRIGYLVASLCLDPQHELLLLLINTIQKDLSSTNYLEVTAALTCISKLLNEEMIPAIFPEIIKLLRDHPNELVRRKCCMALHAVNRIQPQIILSEAVSAIRAALCDSDPGVMAASLHLIHSLAQCDRDAWFDLTPSIVSILKQVTENRLPRDYDYHRVPAPWIQVKLLSVLATLGEGDKSAADQMTEVLIEVIRRAEAGGNVGFAIIYEAVKTATTILPSSRLLDIAAASISRFISADNHNLKYVGICGLAAIIRVQPSFAARPEHQLVVVDCLEDADDTLRRRTLDLLFRMTNPMNVTAVVEKLLLHLRLSVDTDFRRDLASKICRLADRYAPDHGWYVRIINEALELGGGTLVPPSTAHNLLKLIAEGPTGQEAEDEQFRREAVTDYIRSVEKKYETLPEPLLKVASWTIGEYGPLNTLDNYNTLEALLNLLCKCMLRSYEDASTPVWILSAIIKLSILRLLAVVSQQMSSKSNNDLIGDPTANESAAVWPERSVRITATVASVLARIKKLKGTHLEQRYLEFTELVLSPAPQSSFSSIEPVLKEVFPYDASCEDININPSLPFLDRYVSKELSKGAAPYLPPGSRPTCLVSPLSRATPDSPDISLDTSTMNLLQPTNTSLKFTPYAPPPAHPVVSTFISQPSEHVPTVASSFMSIHSTLSNSATQKQSSSTDRGSVSVTMDGLTLQVQGPRRWGPQGYASHTSSAVSPGMNNMVPSSNNLSASAIVGITDSCFSNKIAPSRSENNTDTDRRRQQTEREIAAKALFSGLATQTPPPVSHPLTESPPITWNDQLQQQAQQQRNATPVVQQEATITTNDLLDLDGGTFSPTAYNKSHDNNDVTLIKTTETDEQYSRDTRYHQLPARSLLVTVQPSSVTNNDLASILRGDGPCQLSAQADHEEQKILAPLRTDTLTVGAEWPTLQAEKRESILLHPQIRFPEKLFNQLEVALNVAVVKVIGHEGIAAGRVVSTKYSNALNTPVYIHANLPPNSTHANFIFKGSSAQCLEVLTNKCKCWLQQPYTQ